MTLYHGSDIAGLKSLTPFISEHKEPYVYFSADAAVALLYAVHPVEKPFSWYPFGFDGSGSVRYTEYYPDAFADIYRGKAACLYECDDVPDVFNPTDINSVYVCRYPVGIDRVTEFPDVYERFIEYKAEGRFAIKRFEDISAKESAFAGSYLRGLIREHDLHNKPELKISGLIEKHFNDIWKECGAQTTL
jgi:hypothetical protein